MKKILENRATILLISFTIFAYFMKTALENIFGNVCVTVVNMALLWNSAYNIIEKIIVVIAVLVILFAIIICSLNQNSIELILNIISVVSISLTFFEINKNNNKDC